MDDKFNTSPMSINKIIPSVISLGLKDALKKFKLIKLLFKLYITPKKGKARKIYNLVVKYKYIIYHPLKAKLIDIEQITKMITRKVSNIYL